MEIKEAITFLYGLDDFCESLGNAPDYREALRMAISALEKQIVKTPDYEGD